jgi:SRSO17 transposase
MTKNVKRSVSGMDAQQIGRLEPRLMKFLDTFNGAFGRPEPREHLRTYVRGQLSDLPRKSIEPIALEAQTPPRTLQQFFSRAHWDHDLMRTRLQQRVASGQTDSDVGTLDETSHPKKGNKTPGVKRQHCGATGKKDNCAVTVHLGCARANGFRVLLDGELFLPEDWSDARERCDQAGIPAEMIYRPKWRIGLELLDRANANGVRLPWLTFDEGYGRIPQFHEELNNRGQLYVAEVPCNFCGWCKGLGRGVPASRVDDLVCHSPAFTAQSWEPYFIKEGDKGPIVWEAKFVDTFHPSDAGEPRGPRWLIVARNALDHDEVKYFVSNAPLSTPRQELLRVGFSRFAVERCFEDEKTEIGMDHFEIRNYLSLKRHLIISSVSLLFLAEIHQEDRGEKSGADSLPGAHGIERNDHEFADDRRRSSGILAKSGGKDRVPPKEKRNSPQESSQGDPSPASRHEHQNISHYALSA